MREPAIGSTLAGYRIDARIGRGGMGVVYRATHLGLDRQVALKVIARDLAGDPGFRERFLRESRLAASLDHPAVVPIFDSREVDGDLIVAMRLVEDGDLRNLIDRDGPLAPEKAIGLLGQIAEALDAAHATGIVHRDVKPHNILIEGDRAYLSDFGLAKSLGEGSSVSGTSVVGTVEYMSPEQWRGEAVGPAADVYSLGCVLYEALTGIAPYARKASDTEPEMPAGLDGVIQRAVSKDPADRYPSAAALIEAARECQGATPATTQVLSRREAPTIRLARGAEGAGLGSRVRRKPLLWLGAPIGAVLALAALAFVLLGASDVSVSAPIPIGASPLRIATGQGAVWVTSERDGTLSQVDPDTETLVGAPLRLGVGVSGVTVGQGSVWVADSRTGEILRVDPRERKVIERIPVGGEPGPLAFGGGRVWAADERGAGIASIEASTGAVRRGIAPHTEPLRLAVGAGGLWVSSAETGAVRRIDLGTLAVDAPILVGRGPAGSPWGVAWSGSRTAAPAPSPGSTPRYTGSSATRSQSASVPAASTPGPAPCGWRARRRTRSAGSTSKAARRWAARSASAPNPARSRSARKRSGSPTTETAPLPASSLE